MLLNALLGNGENQGQEKLSNLQAVECKCVYLALITTILTIFNRYLNAY